jgi:hypothetical protein
MTRHLLPIACVLALATTAPRPARAAAAEAPPTVFDGAYQGLLVGGTAGLATGYLFARQDGWNSSKDWKPLAYGAGIGALAGATIGLTLGIVDMSRGKPGRTAYVMQDGLLGAGLGAVLGGIAGGLAALSSGKGEHILLGASIGVLSGTCLGMGIGAVEGGRKYGATVAAVQTADGALTFVPALSGRF